MISSLTETPEDEVYEVVRRYIDALTLLDEHNSFKQRLLLYNPKSFLLKWK